MIGACKAGKAGECYILSNRYITIKEFLGLTAEACGRKKIKTVLPMWFAKLTAPLSELYYSILKQPPLYTRYSLYTLTANARFSHDKADRELGYKTRSFKTTIADTVRWLVGQGAIVSAST